MRQSAPLSGSELALTDLPLLELPEDGGHSTLSTAFPAAGLDLPTASILDGRPERAVTPHTSSPSSFSRLLAFLTSIPQYLYQHPGVHQAIRFGMVGGVNTVVDLSVLNLLMYLQPLGRAGWLYSVFKTMAFLVAVTNSYLLNRRFTFRSEKQASTRQLTHYLIVSIVGLLINVGVATAVVTFVPAPAFLLPWWPSIAALSGIPFGLVWNFLGYRLLVF